MQIRNYLYSITNLEDRGFLVESSNIRFINRLLNRILNIERPFIPPKKTVRTKPLYYIFGSIFSRFCEFCKCSISIPLPFHIETVAYTPLPTFRAESIVVIGVHSSSLLLGNFS